MKEKNLMPKLLSLKVIVKTRSKVYEDKIKNLVGILILWENTVL